jgi:hypothetical protein
MACQAPRSLLSVPDYDGSIRAGEQLSSARSRSLFPRRSRASGRSIRDYDPVVVLLNKVGRIPSASPDRGSGTPRAHGRRFGTEVVADPLGHGRQRLALDVDPDPESRFGLMIRLNASGSRGYSGVYP